MTETKMTNRFFLFFLLYFLAASVGLSYLPFTAALSDNAYMLLAQPLCFLPPIIGYFLLTKKSVRQTLRLKPLGLTNLLLIFLFGIAIQPVMSLLSYAASLFFPNPVEQSLANISASGLLPALLSVAVFPAVLEEFSTRGILLSGYQLLGKWRAALASAFLFALLHLNPQQFPYAFLVGFIFSFLVERTGSIWASILPHFLINATSVAAMFLQPDAATAALAEELTASATLLYLAGQALMSLPGLALLLYLFLKVNPAVPEVPLLCEDGSPYREHFLTPAMVIVLLLYFLLGILPYL